MDNKIFDNIIVFYVEDDEDDQLLFEETLGTVAPNAQLMMFKNGSDLLHAITNPPPIPAIIFVDLNLPGITGHDVIKQIRSNHIFSKLPMIVFSTSDNEQSFEASRQNGASFYIVKPSNYTDFKQALYIALTTNWDTFQLSKDDFVYQPE